MSTIIVRQQITPESVGEQYGFLARCNDCPWKSGMARFEQTAVSMAEGHVYEARHHVSIEEHAP